MERYRALFQSADIVFVDGPKDGMSEYKFLQNLNVLDGAAQPLLIFDDTRLLNMVDVWRKINRPKLDITSFGHWSGTGLVDWNGRSDAVGTL